MALGKYSSSRNGRPPGVHAPSSAWKPNSSISFSNYVSNPYTWTYWPVSFLGWPCSSGMSPQWGRGHCLAASADPPEPSPAACVPGGRSPAYREPRLPAYASPHAQSSQCRTPAPPGVLVEGARSVHTPGTWGPEGHITTLRPEQNGRYFAVKISEYLNSQKTTLVQVMAYKCTGANPVAGHNV